MNSLQNFCASIFSYAAWYFLVFSGWDTTWVQFNLLSDPLEHDRGPIRPVGTMAQEIQRGMLLGSNTQVRKSSVLGVTSYVVLS